VTDTREYPGLVRNDPYLIPKTVQKSGVTLELCDVNWSPGSDYDPSPASYTATASYKGSASGSRPSGYTATATYTGEVVKIVPGNIVLLSRRKLYLAGEYVPKDIPIAIRWFTSAAEQGNQFAQYALGMVLSYLEITPPLSPPFVKLDISDFPAMLAAFRICVQ